MLFPKSTHQQYQDYLINFINLFYVIKKDFLNILKYSKHIIAFFVADLTGFYDIIKHAYTNSPCGAKPKDPVALFRSLILMTYCNFTSIDDWVVELRTTPILAIISGFLPYGYNPSGNEAYLPDTIPGVGTFYDFQKRLILVDKLFHKSHYRKPKKTRKNQNLKKVKNLIIHAQESSTVSAKELWTWVRPNFLTLWSQGLIQSLSMSL